MSRCPNCVDSVLEVETSTGALACTTCGQVLEENQIVSEVTFSETSSGASVLQGQFISSTSTGKASSSVGGYGPFSRESREITLRNGRNKLMSLAASLRLNSHMVEVAMRTFQLAMAQNFIQGRKTQTVVAACMYIACRLEQTPHMLIDFSDVLQINVFVLGDTFSKLARLTRVEHKMPLVDPSLYIQRFASKLEFGDKTHQVAMTALRLVSRMKRDWMQIGRRPSGLCGASLLIAARFHGFKRTHKEIIDVVRVCEITLRNRLIEFEQTPASQLTPQEFASINLEEEADPPSFIIARKKLKTAEKKTAEPDQSESSLKIPDSMVNELESEQRRMDDDLSQLEQQDKDYAKKTEIRRKESKAKVETESLSDLDEDVEVVSAILTEEEAVIKTQLWEEANREYILQQEEKQRLLAENGGQAKAEAKKRKRKQRAEQRLAEPLAQSAAEATFNALNQKRLSKKIDYSVLEKLFDHETKEELEETKPNVEEAIEEDEEEEEEEDETEKVETARALYAKDQQHQDDFADDFADDDD